jgi:hypothetical protein
MTRSSPFRVALAFCVLVWVSFCGAGGISHAEAGTPKGSTDDLLARLYWDRSVQRAGREEVLWLYVRDLEEAHPALEVALEAPADAALLENSTTSISPSDWQQKTIQLGGAFLPSSYPAPLPSARLSWRVRAEKGFSGVFRVTITGEGTETTEDVLDTTFTEPVAPSTADYVPEPIVRDTPELVGMMFFPGWKPGDHMGWAPLEVDYPWRKPALGWYDESDPEATDWQIKWAVEHGVDFFMYDWYRAIGNDGDPLQQQLGHALHEGLFHARYQNRIKFAIMWTNGAYSGVASQEDLMDHLFAFWMQTYFRRPNYLVVDGKPVLFIYDIQRLIEDLGSTENVRAAMDLMRARCVGEGFSGLYVFGESRHWWPDVIQLIADCGLDASFAYCWGNVPDGASDATARSVIMQNLQDRRDWDILPNVPTLSFMWDPSPIEALPNHHASAHYHMSSDSFQMLCGQVKTFMGNLPEGDLGQRMVLLDNWNEWLEGHYLIPCREHGFRYLDAFLEVFGDETASHVDLTPEDVQLGPYDNAYRDWLRTRVAGGTARFSGSQSDREAELFWSDAGAVAQNACTLTFTGAVTGASIARYQADRFYSQFPEVNVLLTEPAVTGVFYPLWVFVNDPEGVTRGHIVARLRDGAAHLLLLDPDYNGVWTSGAIDVSSTLQYRCRVEGADFVFSYCRGSDFMEIGRLNLQALPGLGDATASGWTLPAQILNGSYRGGIDKLIIKGVGVPNRNLEFQECGGEFSCAVGEENNSNGHDGVPAGTIVSLALLLLAFPTAGGFLLRWIR